MRKQVLLSHPIKWRTYTLDPTCCRFSKGPALALVDPAPLASQKDDSEAKTCFVPVYFHDLVKKSVS